MKLTVKFPKLDAQRRRLGARPSKSTISTPALGPRNEVSGPRDELLEELKFGISCNISEIKPRPDQLLGYKGEQILIYIKDNTYHEREVLERNPYKLRRFHIADCFKIKEMRERRRLDRYVVATNNMSGSFWVDYRRPTGEIVEAKAKLQVCMYCLEKLNWKDYESYPFRSSERNEIWQNFSIEEFLGEHCTFFLTTPSRRDSALPNQRPSNWSEVSYLRKFAAGCRCDQCGVELPPNLLHCHHISGNLRDNSNENLRVLCALCHADQPYHQHMNISDSIRKTIQRKRAEQGIGTGSSDPSDAADPVDCTE